jgi:hypothetical protein
VQLATGVGPLSVVVTQVVAVKLLPAAAAAAVQVATGVGPVVAVLQVVVV